MGLLRVTMRGYVGTNACFQVYVVETPGTDYEGAVEVVEYIGNAYFDHLRTFLSNQYALVDGYVQPLIPGGLPGISVSPAPLPFSGTATGELLPQQVAALVSFTALTPRPNRGRKYFGGLTEVAWAGGAWGAGITTGLNNLATELLDMETLLGPGYNFRAWRARPLGTWDLGGVFTEAKTTPYAVVQRRRRPGTGI